MVSVAPKQASDIYHTAKLAPKRDQRMQSSEFLVNRKSFINLGYEMLRSVYFWPSDINLF